MANVDRPRGFAPIGTISGAPWQASQKLFYLDGSANTIAISVGDLVVMTAGGYLNCLAAGNGAADLVGVVTAVSTTSAGFSTTTGTFGGHSLSATEPTLTGSGKNTVAASTAGYVYVCTAPDAILVGQEDGVTTPLTLAGIGGAVDIINAGSNSTTGLSTMEIDSTTVGTQAGDPLKLYGLANTPGNELASVDTTKPWADWMVVYNTTWMQDDGGV